MNSENIDLDVLLKKCRSSPTKGGLMRQATEILRQAGRFREIAELNALAAHARADIPALHVKNIRSWTEAGDVEAAADAAAQAMANNLDAQTLNKVIFRALSVSSRWEEAVPLATKLARELPAEHPIVKKCISVLQSAKKTGEVGDILLEFGRASTSNLRQATEILTQAGRFREIAELNALAAHDRPDIPALHVKNIRSWTKAGDVEAAADAAAQAMANNLDAQTLNKVIFRALSVSSRWEEAVPLAIKLAREYPGDYPVVGQYLSLLRAAGKTEEAKDISSNYTKAPSQRPITRLFAEQLSYMTHYYDGGIMMPAMPYVMQSSPANYSTPVYTTDQRGYRYSVAEDGTQFSPADDPDNKGNMALVGGSTVFGVGSTSNKDTIASLLSYENSFCYNLGTRAFVLQQNTVQFMFELETFANVEQIIFLGGWNELIAAYRCKVFPNVYGPYFSWNEYCRRLNPIIGHFPEDDWPSSQRAHMSTQSDRDDRPPIEEMLAVMDKMLFAWGVLSTNSNAELVYVLQPSSQWIERQPPAEETALLESVADVLSDDSSGDLFDYSANCHEWYANELRNICNQHKIRFIDANKLIENHKDKNKWIFTDTVHLTDVGARIVADALKKELFNG